MKRKTETDSYQISYETVPIEQVAGKERFVSVYLYNAKENVMTDQFKNYLLPLIQGEMLLPMENGLPVYKRVI